MNAMLLDEMLVSVSNVRVRAPHRIFLAGNTVWSKARLTSGSGHYPPQPKSNSKITFCTQF